jgi:hypothetical protein
MLEAMRRAFLPGFLLILGLATTANAQYSGRRRGGATGPLTPGSDSSGLAAVFVGKVTSITKSDLGIQADGGNVLSFSILHKTKFMKDGKAIKRTDIHAGDDVTIQAGEDPTGHPSAITVTFGKPPAPKDDSQPTG